MSNLRINKTKTFLSAREVLTQQSEKENPRSVQDTNVCNRRKENLKSAQETIMIIDEKRSLKVCKVLM